MVTKFDLSKLNKDELQQLIREAEALAEKTSLDNLPKKEKEALIKAYNSISIDDELYQNCDVSVKLDVTVSVFLNRNGELDYFLDDVNYDDDELVELAKKTKPIKDLAREMSNKWKNYNSLLVAAAKKLGVPANELIKILEENE